MTGESSDIFFLSTICRATLDKKRAMAEKEISCVVNDTFQNEKEKLKVGT
jgi:hypothetical protein